MYYNKRLTIPPMTTEADPITTRIKLTTGTIKRIDVGFPAGCAGLAHIRIYHGGWQVVPWTRDQSLSWDCHVFELDHNYPITTAPRFLKLIAWNEDDSYEHTIFVGIVFDEGEPDTFAVQFLQELKRISGQ